jgi:hypothetical protein
MSTLVAVSFRLRHRSFYDFREKLLSPQPSIVYHIISESGVSGAGKIAQGHELPAVSGNKIYLRTQTHSHKYCFSAAVATAEVRLI